MKSIARRIEELEKFFEISSLPDSILEEKLTYESSFYEFVKAAWSQIEGESRFIDNWHIEAICWHLEAVMSGEIKNIIINVPPRTGKSNLISIFWPAWCWAVDPSLRFVYSSYSADLSKIHSIKCRRLIESHWYQERWGNKFQLMRDQNTTIHFSNTATGDRRATSTNSTTVGTGGNILICDDPNNAKDGESEVKRNATLNWWSSIWSTRKNIGQLQSMIVVQQRLHEQDITGYLLSKQDADKWVHLCLPMEYEKNRKTKTIKLPKSNGKVWEDPRTKEGELLWEAGFDKEIVKDLKVQLGSYNYAGQYQQRPAPEEGGLIQRNWFKVWTKEETPVIKYMLQSWDTALTEKTTSDYSACTTWGTFEDENKAINVILISAWRGKVIYPKLLDRAKRLRLNCQDIGKVPLGTNKHNEPDRTIVEAKAAGHPLISDLIAKNITAHAFNPGEYGDKTLRVNLVSSFIECGRVWVLGDKDGNLRADHEDVVAECIVFPKGYHDDYVDSMTQALLYLSKKKRILTHSLAMNFDREKLPKEHMPGYKPPKKGK